MFFCKEVKLF